MSKTKLNPDAMNSTSVLFGRAILAGALLWFAGLPAERANAATNVVLAGENLQTRIDAAASGDVMVIQSGAYGGAISINKALSLVRSGTEDVQFQGPVTINTAGAVALSQLRFADVVNISGGALVSVQESRFDAAVGATVGKLTFRKSVIAGELRLTNTALTGLRLTNQSSVTATAAPNSKVPMNLAQCSFSADLIVTGYSVAMGYSRAVAVGIIDGEATIVGNRIRRTSLERFVHMNTSLFGLRSLLNIYNNDIQVDVYTGLDNLYGIRLQSCDATVANNTVTMTGGSGYVQVISVEGTSSSIRVMGNIFDPGNAAYARYGIYRLDGFSGVLEVSHCCLSPAAQITAGVQTYGTLAADPKLNADRTLAADSPCRNAGPPDAIYNDRDGTRNDIGFTGGPLYNPANYTTDLPIAFWLNTTPRKVLKGINNTIRVDAAATAGH